MFFQAERCNVGVNHETVAGKLPDADWIYPTNEYGY
jgi:hypothetical protein